MNIGSLMIALCCLPILPLVYFVLRNEAKPKKNIVLGVTLPYGYGYRPEVEALCSEYRRELGLWMLAVLAIGLASLLFPWFSIQFSILMMAVLLMCLLPAIPFIRYHQRLQALKLENGWVVEGASIQVDTRAAVMAAVQRRPSDLWFLPPILLALAPMVLELFMEGPPQARSAALIGMGSILLIVIFCPFINRILYRQRTEVLDRNSDLNLALTRLRRRQWSRVNLWLAYLTGVFSVVFWWLMRFTYGEIWIMLVSVLYTLAILAICCSAEFICRRAQERLSLESRHPAYADEDQYWPLGMFYYNPENRRLVVQNRTGLGTTMNLARPMGKAIMAFSALCLLSVPVLCGWMIAEEFTPLVIQSENGQVTVDHLIREASIPLEQIRSTASLNSLPPARKVVGSNLDTLYKGTFEVEGYGVCQLYLNPKQPPFVVVDTQQGRYILPAGEWEEAIDAAPGS